MNLTSSRRLAALLLMLATVTSSSARATTYTWNGDGSSGNWSDSGNWSGSLPPPNQIDTALLFSGTNQLNSNENLTSDFILNALTLDATAGAFHFIGGTFDFRTNSTNVTPVLTDQTASNVRFDNNFALGSNLTINGSGDGTILLNGTVSGTGGLTIDHANGAVILAGTQNTYAGGTTVLDGSILNIKSDASLGAVPATASINLNFGTPETDGGTLQLDSRAGVVTLNANRNIVYQAGVTFDTNGAGNSLTVPGVISGGGGGLSVTGGGTVTLSGANTFNLGTTLYSGTLVINSDASLGGVRSTAHVTLLFEGGGTNTTTLQLARNIGTVSLSPLRYFNIYSSATATFDTNGSANNLIIPGVIQGAGPVDKVGSGTLTLTGANTYLGGTVISRGILNINADAALGDSSGTLSFTGNGGTLQTGVSSLTINREPSIASGATATFDTNGAGNTITLPNRVTGAGNLTLTGGGTLTLSLPGEYTGLTSVKAGTLILQGGGNAPQLSGDLVIGNAANPGAADSAVVLLNQSDFYHGSTTNLTVYTDGLFNLNNQFTDINSLTMTGGEVRLGSEGMLLNGNVTINASSTGSLLSSTNRSDNLNLSTALGAQSTFNVARGTGTYDLDVQAGITQGSLTKTGAGVLRLAGTANDTLTVTLQAGTIAIASNTALGNTAGSNTFTFAGGTVTADGADRTLANPVTLTGSGVIGASLDGSARALTFTGALTVGGSYSLTNNNNAATTFGSTVALGGNTLTLDGSGNTTFSGVISGSGGLNQTGSGSTTLSGANTFNGATSITGGSIVLGSASVLANSAVTTGGVGTLGFAGGINNFYLGSLGGSGNVTLTDANGGAANLSLGANNTSTTYSGALTGIGGLTKTGGGTLTLSGNNSFAGQTSINGGTLAVTGGGFGTSYLYVGDAGGGIMTQTGGSVLTNGGTFAMGNSNGISGTYALSGASSTLSTGSAEIGTRGTGSFTQNDGSVTTNGNLFALGLSADSTGTYTLNAGTLTTGVAYVGQNGSGVFYQNGGSFTTTNNGGLIVGDLSGSSGVYNLNGGVLTTRGVAGLNGTGTFNFNGGTLQASQGSTAFLAGMKVANVRGSASVANSGVVIDTNGFDITVLQNLMHSTISGDAAVDGGLTKVGAGTLALTSNNSYNGVTNVNAGTLLANNTIGSALGTGAVTVTGAGTVLGGTGSIAGPVTINGGAGVLGGNGSAASGALTLSGGLTLNTGSLVELALGANGTHSTLTRGGAGTWTFAGNQAFTFVNSTAAQPGVYDNIITGLASDPGGESGWTITNAGFAGSFRFDGAGDIDLTLTSVPEPATWLAGLLTVLLAASVWRRRTQRA